MYVMQKLFVMVAVHCYCKKESAAFRILIGPFFKVDAHALPVVHTYIGMYIIMLCMTDSIIHVYSPVVTFVVQLQLSGKTKGITKLPLLIVTHVLRKG